ncbi:MAG: LysM peptidoglycan-binding domain-containing protein [Oscillospiraceae bacterium]|nr:LysM peptidoglycan-binding domain-containing protein [Oscillospiraceae bacterium]
MNGNYRIYLSFNNLQEAIELPVLPEKLTISQSGSNKTYDLLNTGQINIIKGLELPQLELAGYFPVDEAHVTAQALYAPMYYVDRILKWAATLRPIRLTMTGTLELSWPVSIEAFSYTEEGGAVGDVSYRLSLKKYVFFGPARAVTAGGKTVAVSMRADEQTPPGTVVARQNEDTFWILAKKYLGDGSKASQLAALNGLPLDNVLFPGQMVKLS